MVRHGIQESLAQEGGMRQKIGILGGMGTAAGLHFTRVLVESNVGARNDHDHPAFLLYSEPGIPSRVEACAGNRPSPVGAIVKILHQMAQAEVGFAVMVCNTAHIFFDEIRSRSPLKLLHIIENAANRSKHIGGSKFGLLATTATVDSGIYQRFFARTGREIVVPERLCQERIMSSIFDSSYGIKATNTAISVQALAELKEVADRLRSKEGVDTLILGCTELSMAIPSETWHGFRVIDPVRLLAEASLQLAGYVPQEDCSPEMD